MIKSKNTQIFKNSTEAFDWLDLNCRRCKYGYNWDAEIGEDEHIPESECNHEKLLSYAATTEFEVPKGTAKYIGFRKGSKLNQCPHFEEK